MPACLECLPELGAGIKGWVDKKVREDLCDLLRWEQRGVGGCRDLGLDWRTGFGGVDGVVEILVRLPTASLPGLDFRFSGNACWSWALG